MPWVQSDDEYKGQNRGYPLWEFHPCIPPKHIASDWHDSSKKTCLWTTLNDGMVSNLNKILRGLWIMYVWLPSWSCACTYSNISLKNTWNHWASTLMVSPNQGTVRTRFSHDLQHTPWFPCPNLQKLPPNHHPWEYVVSEKWDSCTPRGLHHDEYWWW